MYYSKYKSHYPRFRLLKAAGFIKRRTAFSAGVCFLFPTFFPYSADGNDTKERCVGWDEPAEEDIKQKQGILSFFLSLHGKDNPSNLNSLWIC